MANFVPSGHWECESGCEREHFLIKGSPMVGPEPRRYLTGHLLNA